MYITEARAEMREKQRTPGKIDKRNYVTNDIKLLSNCIKYYQKPIIILIQLKKSKINFIV